MLCGQNRKKREDLSGRDVDSGAAFLPLEVQAPSSVHTSLVPMGKVVGRQLRE